MVEELEVIRSQIQRFLENKLEGKSVEDFLATDWVGGLEGLLTQSNYRFPSVLDRACSYLSSIGNEDAAKQLRSLLGPLVPTIRDFEAKVKADYEPHYVARPDGTPRFAGIVSPHWEAFDDVLDKAVLIYELCDRLQGYATTTVNVETSRDPKRQRLLEAWNAEDPAIKWDDFAFFHEQLHGRGDAMRQRLTRYADRTGQYIRKSEPGPKIY